MPAGERVYAIGDIHGRDDLFAQLLDRIAADDAARGPARTTLILLGDLVDRGPDSRGVVERAMQLQRGPMQLRWLVGNHEEIFLDALRGDPQLLRFFHRVGGEATLLSYGIDAMAYRTASFEELAPLLEGLVPDAHRSFLGGGEDMIRIGDYLFVHAGIAPDVPLDQQRIADLRWIRQRFLDDERDHGVVVVHGHSTVEEVDQRPNRIGIDTGAYRTGVLTAVGLEGDQRWLLDTRAD